jgi:hypothetical protein
MTDDKLRQAAEALLAYRKRSGSLNFQLEKAGDHFRALREALDAPRLAWTKERPETIGWYWIRKLDGSTLIALLDLDYDGSLVWYALESTMPLDYPRFAAFAGPIPMPKEA